MRIRLRWCWYDLWMGAYWDRKSRVLYVCLVPTVVIEVSKRAPVEPKELVALRCCCGDPRVEAEGMGPCDHCFIGLHDKCFHPVRVRSDGIIMRTVAT